jgi:hypothetical protein
MISDKQNAERVKRLLADPHFVPAPMTRAGFITPMTRPKPSTPAAELTPEQQASVEDASQNPTDGR